MKDLSDADKKLLEEIENTTWDDVLCESGKSIEEVGRMLHGRGRTKPRVWSIEELQALRSALKDHRRVIKFYIDHLKMEAKNA